MVCNVKWKNKNKSMVLNLVLKLLKLEVLLEGQNYSILVLMLIMARLSWPHCYYLDTYYMKVMKDVVFNNMGIRSWLCQGCIEHVNPLKDIVICIILKIYNFFGMPIIIRKFLWPIFSLKLIFFPIKFFKKNY